MSISKITGIATESVQKLLTKTPANNSVPTEIIPPIESIIGSSALDALALQGKALLKKATTLKDVVFSRGVALNKNGDKFSGLIKDTLPNGDSVRLLYKNGALQQSTRKGSSCFDKCYIYRDDSKKPFGVVKIRDVVEKVTKAFDENNNPKKLVFLERKKELASYDFHDNGKLKFVKLFNEDTKEFDKEGKYIDEDCFLGVLYDMFINDRFDDFSFLSLFQL